MKPKPLDPKPQDDLFKIRLDDLVNKNHALVRMAEVMHWDLLDDELGAEFCATAGAPALPTRLMAGLMYLQHTYNLSDEAVVDRWVDSPSFQFFCGESFYRHDMPCHPTSLTRWRQRIGEAGCEWLLTLTIEAALKLKVITNTSLKRVVVDTTVQEKNIRFPTDSHLYNQMRKHLVAIAHDHGLVLHQTYAKDCRHLMPKIGRYGHAKQYKRMRKAVKQVKGYLGRVLRDLQRQVDQQNIGLTDRQCDRLEQAQRLLKQTKKSNNKLYSLHEPHVDCISKGKAHKRYEFGVKASITTTAKEAFIVGARSYAGNPYDGHTLKDQLEQVSVLTNNTPQTGYVDRGYRGHGVENTRMIIAGQKRGISNTEQRWLKRRNSVEAIIGHLKADGRMRRCYLKGVQGDALNVLLCACGQNLRKLLKWLSWDKIYGLLLRQFNRIGLRYAVTVGQQPFLMA
jgi:IS5 family transposase|tara:strand:+ start:781 stop:2139 length:1359 start_codon:yes stop_codon:yes gene_type:complete